MGNISKSIQKVFEHASPVITNKITHLRHVFGSDVLDLELDILALVADETRRGDVAIFVESEGLGPLHLVPSHVEVDRRLLPPSRAGTGPIGRTCRAEMTDQ